MTRSAARLFVDDRLADDELRLDERLAHYAAHVLRLGVGEPVVVFNGLGVERRGTIDRLTRRECRLRLLESLTPLPDSPVAVTLIQGLIKPDRMDLIVQKATELGTRRIIAAKTDFSAVKLDAARAERKLGHWRRIAESACEQSGRHRPPQIDYQRSLADAIAGCAGQPLIAFHNDMDASPAEPDVTVDGDIGLIVGPEGGFSPAELELLAARQCRFRRIGQRVLRAETAAIVACALAQLRWGDLS